MSAARPGALWLSLLVSPLACGAAPAAEPAWPGPLCHARVSGAPAAAAEAAALSVPTSRVMVDVVVPVDAMKAALERAVPAELVDRRGVDVGQAGQLSLRVTRGAFAVSARGDDLVVDVDLFGRASFCKPLGLLGCVSYASCEPAAHGRAEVTLALDGQYRLPPSRVEIPITRACTMTALGLDVTDDFSKEAAAQARTIRERIDGGVPAVAELVADLWRALGTSVPLGNGACARLSPRAVVQTGLRARGATLSLGVGAEGEIVVESPCRASAPSATIPPPRITRDAATGVHLEVPVVVSWEQASLALARALSAHEPRVGAERVHVTDARAEPDGDRVRLVLALSGRTCGQIALTARPSPREDLARIDLVELAPLAGESARSGLDLELLARELAPHLSLPLPLNPAAVPRRIDKIAATLLAHDASDPDAPSLQVSMHKASLQRAEVRREGVVGALVADGDATVSLRGAR
ncbi:MAG: DUF4403 family protein [Polyangiaceae bacterium]|nr:DUF4403 family protein [Polyangiaceae bacterium]